MGRLVLDAVHCAVENAVVQYPGYVDPLAEQSGNRHPDDDLLSPRVKVPKIETSILWNHKKRGDSV